MIVDEKIQRLENKKSRLSRDLLLSLLHEGNFIHVNTFGMSMYPFVKSGDRIKIIPMNGKNIKIGDIIAVNRENNKMEGLFLVHRVVKIEVDNGSKIYFTKGDAHKRGFDSPVAIESIAGKITEIHRRGLKIDLDRPLSRYFNSVIAKLSLSHPRVLHFLSKYISLIIEWRIFLFKVKNRLKKGDPISYNTEELLLLCAQKALGEDLRKKAADLVKEGVYWGRFVESAMKGGVTVLVYNALRGVCHYTHIPQFALDRLRSGYLFIVSKTASQYRQIMELLKLFAKKDFAAIPMKGTSLSNRLYEDVAARGLSVDYYLLIKEKDRERITALLEGIGYKSFPDDELKRWQWQHLFNKSGFTAIELHWDITMTCRSKKRIEGIWNGTRQVEENGVSYCELKEEELLLYLCAHLVSSNACRQLRYVCDIDRLLDKYGELISWDSVIKKAKRWKLSSSLYAGLMLSKSLLGSRISHVVLDSIKPAPAKKYFINFFANKKVILRENVRKKFIGTFLSYVFFELIESQSFSEYIAVIKKVLLPPKEALLSIKKDDSIPLYMRYIGRFFRGCFKLLRS